MEKIMTTRRTFLKLAGLGLVTAPVLANAATTHTVTITNFSFTPATLTVAAGDTVVFTNEDRAPHTATADNGSFDTGNLRRGDSASITFASAGSLSYACRFHPNMKGTISVS